MQESILIICRFAHIASTVFWVGGIVFILFFAMPSSRHVMGAESGKLMGEISKRFTPFANWSIIILIATGVVLAVLNKQYSGIPFFQNKWGFALALKLTPALGMAAIHFYRGLALGPKIMRTADAAKKTALQRLSSNLVKVNFALGLLVILISGALSVFRGY